MVETIGEADARAAGYASAAEAMAAWAHRGGALHRIALRPDGPDPRIALRETPPDAAVFAKLERMGGWTYEILQAIDDHPGLRAPDLAASFGRETLPFKRDVRKLKELGLTISLPIGYQLSPRGQLTLSSWPKARRNTSPWRSVAQRAIVTSSSACRCSSTWPSATLTSVAWTAWSRERSSCSAMRTVAAMRLSSSSSPLRATAENSPRPGLPLRW